MSLFLEQKYREYLDKTLKSPKFGRGSKAKLASYLNCQASFVSQVLKEKNTFNLEQAYRVSLFLNHTELERDYFLTLVELDRAGTQELKKYFLEKIKALRKKAEKVENRIRFDELSEKEALMYFSNWNQVMIRQLVDIPEYQSYEALKEKLKLSDQKLKQALDFLLENKLILKEGEKYSMGPKKIHVKKASPLSQFINVQARLQSLKNLDLTNEEAFNFGAQMTLSEEKYKIFKTQLKDLISDLHKSITDDNAEKMCSLVIDFMEV